MIALESVSVAAGDFALREVSFELAAGEYAVLMGRTGCGKTTLLEVLCGLRPVRDGRVRIGGVDVTHAPPGARGVGYVPQDGALFGRLSVREHLAFALRIRGIGRAEIDARVAELAEMLALTRLLERRPRGLSGGERQRVALGRALAVRPAVLCLDEPLSALDDETREEMYAALTAVRERSPVTALHVTHSRHEAERLGDRIFRLEDGRIRAAGGEPDEPSPR